jgi:hypothetical protein
MRRRLVALMAVALISASCDRDAADGSRGGMAAAPSSVAPTPSEAFMPSVSVAPSPTRPAVPHPPPKTRGAPSATCVEGWRTPPRDTPMFTDPLGIIRRTSPVDGDFVVVDMRMFVGPESPPSPDKGYLQDIRRWYIKLYVESDWSYAGRFIVESRLFGRGLAAVAPYDSTGFRSPEWTGFQWDSTDTEARPYPGLPGRWQGIPYDFVDGGAGLDIAGLPDEVTGCLEGT